MHFKVQINANVRYFQFSQMRQ